jgi:hypothetical protein
MERWTVGTVVSATRVVGGSIRADVRPVGPLGAGRRLPPYMGKPVLPPFALRSHPFVGPPRSTDPGPRRHQRIVSCLGRELLFISTVLASRGPPQSHRPIVSRVRGSAVALSPSLRLPVKSRARSLAGRGQSAHGEPGTIKARTVLMPGR